MNQAEASNEVILSSYGHVLDATPMPDRDEYFIVNAKGKCWTLTGEQAEAGKKGTPLPSYAVVWRVKGEQKVETHTSKPTALAHIKGLKRNPRVTAIALYPITEEAYVSPS